MSEPKHLLVEYEEDFLEDGTVAVCSCGWRSPRGPKIMADADLRFHVAAENRKLAPHES